MKSSFALLLSLALLSGSAAAQTRHNFTITVESVAREFIVSRPSTAAPAGGYPVVMMFHGSSGTGQQFYNISGWKEIGEEENFITVFPSGLEYCTADSSGNQQHDTKWNTGALEQTACPGEVLRDDVLFIRSMLDTIRKAFPVDRRRIYASGFSNGGVFASKLAVEMSDILAAATASGGAINPNDIGVPQRMIPFFYTVGTLDEKALQDLRVREIPFNDSTLVLLGPNIDRYLSIFNLTSAHTKTEGANGITWHYSTPASSAPAGDLRVAIIKDATHQFPNGTNHPLVMAQGFWQFFQQFSLPSRVVVLAGDHAAVKIYPNPARGSVTVDAGDATRIVVRDILGQPMLERQITGRATIDLQGLPSGLYLIEMQGGTGIATGILRIE